MTEEPRYTLDELSSIAYDPGPELDIRFDPTTTSSSNGHAELDPVQIVSLRRFVETTDDVAEPLIGTIDSALLPADGFLLMYGDGGAGKTTLAVDALAHLAAGSDWLGQTIPRPLSVMLVENEGPRGPFRRKLARKVDHWAGDPFVDRVTVLEEPWATFTLATPEYRWQLGQEIARNETDLVIVGPLASLGAKGTGTPDEVSEFDRLVGDLRQNAGRPFGLWIVHHENKAGDVSGAWERLPDTLVHVSAQGNGKTRVHWRKTRWSGELHNTSVTLTWAENSGFTIDEKAERNIRAELLEAFRADDRWRTSKEAAGLIAAQPDNVRDALVDLVKTNDMRFEIGPSGRHVTARCWRLIGDLEASGHLRSPTLLEGDELGGDLLTRPIGKGQAGHLHPQTDQPDLKPPGHPDGDIPF